MQRLAELIRREPLVVRSLAAAIIGILAAWGVISWTDAQTEAVLTLTSVLLPIIVAAVTRGKVTPVDKRPTTADQSADEATADADEPATATEESR